MVAVSDSEIGTPVKMEQIHGLISDSEISSVNWLVVELLVKVDEFIMH